MTLDANANSFQIQPLAAGSFAHYFDMSEGELAACQARRIVADSKPGFPCRVSLEDAEIGETLILIHHTHQPADSPFRASHAIYVREGVASATLKPGYVPELIRMRLISLRGFDETHMMVDADAVPGDDLSQAISTMFENDAVSYVHLHYAKQGCFAAKVERV